MARWMKFEENDDETISLVVHLDEDMEDQSFVIPFGFEALLNQMSPEMLEHAWQFSQENVIHVPNNAEDTHP